MRIRKTELIIGILFISILIGAFILSIRNSDNDWEQFYSDKMLLTDLEHDHELLVKSISIRQGIDIVNHKFSLEGVFCEENERFPYLNNHIEIDDKIKIVRKDGSLSIILNRNGIEYIFSDRFCNH